jgi:peptide/nickel transport system permease protein
MSSLTVMSDTALQAAPATKARGYWATCRPPHRARQGQHGLRLRSGADLLSALFAPWLGLADPYQGSMIRRLRHIGTPNYPLGTDELGRDMLARLIYGGRLSLIIGILPVILAFMIGTSLGLVAGYVGGKLNTAIMRTIDVFYAFPVGAAGDCDLRRAGRGHRQLHRLADDRVRAADHPRRGKRHHRRAQHGFRRGRARLRRRAFHHHARAHAGQRARADLRLRHRADLGVDDPRRRPVLPRARHKPPEPEWGLMLNTLRTAIYVNPWVAALPAS